MHKSMKRAVWVLVCVLLLAAGAAWAATLNPLANEGYTQEHYSNESGDENSLYGLGIDGYGDYYRMKKNVGDTVSYIYKNFKQGDTVPFITINGNVQGFSVTSDRDASYLYYKLTDNDTTMYRLPLVENATGAVSRTFTFAEGSNFIFQSFTLAQDPDEFLLYSSHDDNLNVKVGLFSFDGGVTPIRTWTGTLSQEWKDNYFTMGGALGYYVTFEASTGKIWLIAQRTYRNLSDQGEFANLAGWFYQGDISTSGNLVPYSPSSGIPGWEAGNLKILTIGRYRRIVNEYNGDLPKELLSIRVFDPVSGQFNAETLTTWMDGETERPIDEFFNLETESTNWWTSFGYTADGQGYLYLDFYQNESYSLYTRHTSRFLLFSPTEGADFGTPEPAPSASDGAEFGINVPVVLEYVPPLMPAGTEITGARWRLFKASDHSLVYEEETAGSAPTHSIPAGTLPVGEYLWSVSCYTRRTGGGVTQEGATKWSAETAISVVYPIITPPPTTTTVPVTNTTVAPVITTPPITTTIPLVTTTVPVTTLAPITTTTAPVITATPSPTATTSSSGGGGCDAIGGAVFLLLPFVPFVRRKK